MADPDLVRAAERLLNWVISLSEQEDTNALDSLERLRREHIVEVEDARIAIDKAKGAA